jgi:hypothetical protein
MKIFRLTQQVCGIGRMQANHGVPGGVGSRQKDGEWIG